MRLQQRALILEETVINESTDLAHFVWGHHCVLGPPFIEDGCRLDVAANTIITRPQPWEDTARLACGQHSPWPKAQLRGGGVVDLSKVPGPEAGSHDDVYLTDLNGGWAAVVNPRLDLTFRLDWDPAIFRWIVLWQPYGGAEAMPLRGVYAVGIEPWTTPMNLEQALAAGHAIELPGGEQFRTSIRASFAAAS